MTLIKSVLILAIGILLSSCSTDPKRNLLENTESEQLIGPWKPIKFVAVHQDGTSNSFETYGGCGEYTRWTFAKSGRFSKEEVIANANGSCEHDREGATIESGTWALLEQDTLSIFISYTDGGMALYRSEIRFLDTSTLRLSYEGDVPEMEYFYVEFARVE